MSISDKFKKFLSSSRGTQRDVPRYGAPGDECTRFILNLPKGIPSPTKLFEFRPLLLELFFSKSATVGQEHVEVRYSRVFSADCKR